MSAIDTRLPVDLTQLKPLKPTKPEKGDEQMARAIEQMIEQMQTRPAGTSGGSPENLYAEVKVNGKTVAKLYNSGAAATPNALSGLKLSSDGNGPQLAQQRAEEIAEATGGTIVKASTALTQKQWSELPPRQFTTDWDAVERQKQLWYAGTQQRQMIANPAMLVQAQLLGQQAVGAE
jgi:hypothetical protein